MTDPNQAVAEQLAGQAASVPVQGVDEQELAAAAQSHIGQGVTEADIEGILAQIKAMQARLDQAEAERRASTPDTISSSVDQLFHQLLNHGDTIAIELGKDAVEAAKSIAEGGSIGPLMTIAEKLTARLLKNPPAPGDQFHYRQVLDTAQTHIPDVLNAYQPPPQSAGAIGSDRAPAKVVAGSVVG